MSGVSFDHQRFLHHLTAAPGVYRMFDADGVIIYVGKAKSLKKRVSSYFSSREQTPKTAALVRQIAQIEVTVTQNEIEALLLEQRLIKRHRPKYNILFRDDKSYPYAYLNTQHPFPRLMAYRGARPKKGRLFGPYPSMYMLQKTVQLLQQIFRIRQCEDSVFAHRSRPCLQYQINRCSAPCVGKISAADYQADIEAVRLFLAGKNQKVMADLMARMAAAAEAMQYELAAKYRDQIAALRDTQQTQVIETGRQEQVDVIAIARLKGRVCLYLLMIRHGQMLGGRHFLPEDVQLTDDQLLETFLAQWYTHESEAPDTTSFSLPKHVLIDSGQVVSDALKALLNQLHADLHVRVARQGVESKWLKMAQMNAQHTILNQLKVDRDTLLGLQDLAEVLQLSTVPARIECFDISHTQGEATTASCVVLTESGLAKSEYRRYRIQDVQAGDDYAAIQQVVTRRYQRQLAEEKPLPDIVLIDGGQGQLARAAEALAEVGFHDVVVLSIAKGPARRAGEEKIWRLAAELPVSIPGDAPAHLCLQKIRDEAHRFAITGHRKQRHQQSMRSTLQTIPGVGPQRRQALLRYFGGWQALKVATADEISKVPGISVALATRIAQVLQSDG